MSLWQLAGLAICIPANLLASAVGRYCSVGQDRDLLLPLSSVFFTFYPLVISLPEAHFKLINYTSQQMGNVNEEDVFPYAFLLCLFSFTISAIVDHKFLREGGEEDEVEGEEKVKSNQTTLRFYLSLSIALQNLVNYYYICMQSQEGQLVKEIFLFILFSIILNFCFSYLLTENGTPKGTTLRLSIYLNAGVICGWILGQFFEPDIALLALPCICAGLQLYTSLFICFPRLFSGGQRPSEDRSRFCSILIAFLLSVIYYPICYLLRI